MHGMTIEEKQAYLTARAEQRTQIQTRIQEVAQQRQAFIDEEMQRQQLDATKSFGFVIRQAVREQAMTRGFTFENALANPAPEVEAEMGPSILDAELQPISTGDGC